MGIMQKIISNIKARRKSKKLIKNSGKPNISAMQRYANRANLRLAELERAFFKRGIRSSAYEETGGYRFKFNKRMTKEDFIEESTRLFKFLSSASSTVKGANVESAMLSAEKYADMFGSQWKSNKWHKSYSPDLDENILKEIFADYRRLEEDKAGLIYDGFGSSNLISYLYDMYIEGEENPIAKANEVLNDFYQSAFNDYKLYNEYEDLSRMLWK